LESNLSPGFAAGLGRSFRKLLSSSALEQGDINGDVAFMQSILNQGRVEARFLWFTGNESFFGLRQRSSGFGQ
jgi:hypothetical protein